MDFSENSDDLNEFIALEKQIRAEPQEQLEEFANLFKSQHTSVKSSQINDVFGDLNLNGQDFGYQQPSATVQRPVHFQSSYEAPKQEVQKRSKPEASQQVTQQQIQQPQSSQIQPVRLTKASRQVLNSRLQAAQQVPEEPDQEKNFDVQLQQLDIEIQKYKRLQEETKEEARNLRLDVQQELRSLEKEKQEFSKYVAQQKAQFQQQKKIQDEARDSRQQKERQYKEQQALLQQCQQENSSLKAEIKRMQNSGKSSLEIVRIENEKLIKEKNDLVARLEEQDAAMLQNKKQIQLLQKQVKEREQGSHEADQQLANLQQQLKEMEIRLEEKEKMIQEQKDQVMQLASKQAKIYVKSDVAKQNQELSSQAAAKISISDVKQQAMQQQQQPQQQQQKLQQLSLPEEQQQFDQLNTKQQQNNNKVRTPTKIHSKSQQSLLVDRKQFSNIPFFDKQELFDQFNQDIQLFIDDSEIVQSKKLQDREEFVYASKAKRFIFKNGTEKIVLPNAITDIQFDNGDIKRVNLDTQLSVYYYADVGTLFTQLQTSQGLLKVYRFSNDQMEKHYEDGRKVVYYPDGTMKYVYADGTEKAVFPDGEVVYN